MRIFITSFVLQKSKRIKIIFTLVAFVSSLLCNCTMAAAAVMPAALTPLFNTSSVDGPYLAGMRFYDNDLLKFDFILNKNYTRLDASALHAQGDKMLGYFLAALTLPAKNLWVNLSPYEKARIAPDDLSATELGRDLLDADYLLKQLAASLTHPKTEAGKKYWSDINGSRPSFTKVWIVPGEISFYEDGDRVMIRKATLKVMTDNDYLAMQKNNVGVDLRVDPKQDNGRTHGSAPADAFKTHILPLIEKEVNTGKDFVCLRQIYHALILAVWLKAKFSATPLSDGYFDKSKTNGVENDDPMVRAKVFDAYVSAFKKGAYDYTERVRLPQANRVQSRHYFSGGAAMNTLPSKVEQASRVSGADGAVRVMGAEALGMQVDLRDAQEPVPVKTPAPSTDFWQNNEIPEGGLVGFGDITKGSLRPQAYGDHATDQAFSRLKASAAEALSSIGASRGLSDMQLPVPTFTKGGDEVRTAIRPVIRGDGSVDTPTTRAVFREAVADVNFSSVEASLRRYEEMGEPIDADPLIIPVGAAQVRDGVSSQDAYNRIILEAEWAQQSAKRRQIDAVAALSATAGTAHVDKGEHLPAAITVQAKFNAQNYSDKVKRVFGKRFNVEEKLAPCISSRMLNGQDVSEQDFWREFLTAVQEQREPGEWVVRGPPDTFYIVRNFAFDGRQSQLQIIKVGAYYHGALGKAKKDFISILRASGRAMVMRDGDDRVMGGFKIPNDAWGHVYGNDLIGLIGLSIFSRFVSTGQSNQEELDGESIVSKLCATLTAVNEVTMKQQGYEVFFEAAEVTDGVLSSNGLVMLDTLNNISQARKSPARIVADDSSSIRRMVPGEKHRRAFVELKRYVDNAAQWSAILQENSQSNRFIKERAKKEIYLDTKRLLASLFLARTIGKRSGYGYDFVDDIQDEMGLLRLVTGDGLDSGIMQNIGAYAPVVQEDGLVMYDELRSVMQVGIMLSRVDKHGGLSGRTVEQIIEDNRRILGYMHDKHNAGRDESNQYFLDAVKNIAAVFNVFQAQGVEAARQEYARRRYEDAEGLTDYGFKRMPEAMRDGIERIFGRFFEIGSSSQGGQGENEAEQPQVMAVAVGSGAGNKSDLGGVDLDTGRAQVSFSGRRVKVSLKYSKELKDRLARSRGLRANILRFMPVATFDSLSPSYTSTSIFKN